jgi:pilus assembly protein CpaE
MAEKILLVDDDMDTLRLVGLMLQRQGYEVRAANSGIQALAIIQNELPDLILLDVMMPEIDGYEVARRLRSDSKTSNIPIIMFTAKSQVDDKVMGFEAGADDYLTKPTQPRELFAHMKAVLTRSKKAHQEIETSGLSTKGCTIGVTAGKGGLGVTTLAINLGILIQREHRKDVIIADFKPGQGGIALELGYLKAEGLNRLLQNKPEDLHAKEIGVELTTHSSGMRLLLASQRPRDAQYANMHKHFEIIAKYLSSLTNYLILDLGPALTPANLVLLKRCNEILLVVEPVPHTLMQSKWLMEDLVRNGINDDNISVVLINRIRSGAQLSWSQVQEQLERNLSVIFTPAPELAYQSSIQSSPLVIQQPDSLTSQQFQKLAEKTIRQHPQ